MKHSLVERCNNRYDLHNDINQVSHSRHKVAHCQLPQFQYGITVSFDVNESNT